MEMKPLTKNRKSRQISGLSGHEDKLGLEYIEAEVVGGNAGRAV